MRPPEPLRAGAARPIVAIAATYVFFLLFAQFGFLEVLQRRLGSSAEVRVAMLAMGLAGLAFSLATALLIGRREPRRLTRVGFLGCGMAALLAPVAATPAALVAVSAAVGAFAAILTVSLAAGLRAWLPGGGFGLKVGGATGLAYLVCNLPPVFEAAPAAQALFAAAVCGLGWLVSRPAAAAAKAAGAARPARLERWTPRPTWRFVAVLASFLALVWLDSAAFAVIQEAAELKALTWGSGSQKLALGLVHLLAAVAGGWLLDRGALRGLLLTTFVLFTVAFSLLTGGWALAAVAGPIYAVGISFYSTALVVYAARGGRGGLNRAWRAALVYGVAGWLGSALGVGMAQDLHAIPGWFLAAAGTLIALSWALDRSPLARALGRVYSPALLWTVAAAVVASALHGLGGAAPAEASGAEESQIARGRRVYIAEGCINCHTRFVRCGTEDETLWGPCGSPDPAAAPPLIGNRRQGPDLLNAGNRRGPRWHRLHLEDPRALSPGSRMPSYRHLFTSGSRGDDLVAYLSSLGRETAPARFAFTQTFPIADRGDQGSVTAGAVLFRHHCAACHGIEGRGDGPLDLRSTRSTAIDLTKGDFWLVPSGPGAGSEAQALARVIRFGVPGTSMPGHETFSQAEVADLVAYVRSLARTRTVDAGPADAAGGGSRR